MRKALVVGIDEYANWHPLQGCVSDARAIAKALERNADSSPNFATKLLEGSPGAAVSRSDMLDALDELFDSDPEIALFYFAGHGLPHNGSTYLSSSTASRADEGVSISDIVGRANKSRARNRIVIVDSCHSDVATDDAGVPIPLNSGVTVLSASEAGQYATETSSGGTFTGLLLDALDGSAANLVGEITPGAIYSHIDQALGPWQQRPVFKTNVRSFVSLRRVRAPIERRDLLLISCLFQQPQDSLELDPTFEPELRGRSSEMPAPISSNVEVFEVLQQYNRLNLLVPVGTKHMWHAAMESKSCRLTSLGRHYWRLVKEGRI